MGFTLNDFKTPMWMLVITLLSAFGALHVIPNSDAHVFLSLAVIFGGGTTLFTFGLALFD